MRFYGYKIGHSHRLGKLTGGYGVGKVRRPQAGMDAWRTSPGRGAAGKNGSEAATEGAEGVVLAGIGRTMSVPSITDGRN